MQVINEDEHINSVINSILKRKPMSVKSNSDATIMDVSDNESADLEQSQTVAFQLPKRKRNQKSPVQISGILKSRKITDFMAVATANRFEPLAQNDKESEAAPLIIIKPPPIFIPDVVKIAPLTTLIEKEIGKEYCLKIIRSNEVKIQLKTEEQYSKITKVLKQNNIIFHTYQLKSEKKYRVVICNLHHSTDVENLKAELDELGHKAVNIYNIKHRVTKAPLSMFFVDLQAAANNKNIFNIKVLQHTKIVIEPPKQRRETPQCTRCQRYGHTKTYCFRDPRCVKCGQDHLTKSCVKPRDTDATCALCNGNHPSNYKGCEIYKKIQQKNYPALRKKVPIFPHTEKPIIRNSFSNPNVSFAEIVKGGAHHTKKQADVHLEDETYPNQQQQSNTDKLEKLVISLMERMDSMFNLLTTVVNKLVNGSHP